MTILPYHSLAGKLNLDLCTPHNDYAHTLMINRFNFNQMMALKKTLRITKVIMLMSEIYVYVYIRLLCSIYYNWVLHPLLQLYCSSWDMTSFKFLAVSSKQDNLAQFTYKWRCFSAVRLACAVFRAPGLSSLRAPVNSTFPMEQIRGLVRELSLR